MLEASSRPARGPKRRPIHGRFNRPGSEDPTMDIESLRSEVQRDVEDVTRVMNRGQPIDPRIEELSGQRLPLWRQAAEAGVPGGQWLVGCCCENGLGLPQDAAEAVRWYRLAAEQGHPHAQTNLGPCSERGVGMAEDKDEAGRWDRPGAGPGVPRGQNSLGPAHAPGAGGERRPARAARRL